MKITSEIVPQPKPPRIFKLELNEDEILVIIGVLGHATYYQAQKYINQSVFNYKHKDVSLLDTKINIDNIVNGIRDELNRISH